MEERRTLEAPIAVSSSARSLARVLCFSVLGICSWSSMDWVSMET
ncbi:hypothetical protein EVA_11963 [gut metagenome]|uniref:Uncharacterized protein n=1 Tax=gut metagenome TaxID=749906 RepID=J9CIN0_9ZZZZ